MALYATGSGADFHGLGSRRSTWLRWSVFFWLLAGVELSRETRSARKSVCFQASSKNATWALDALPCDTQVRWGSFPRRGTSKPPHGRWNPPPRAWASVDFLRLPAGAGLFRETRSRIVFGCLLAWSCLGRPVRLGSRFAFRLWSRGGGNLRV